MVKFKVEIRECLAFDWVTYGIMANTLNQAIRKAKEMSGDGNEDVIVYTRSGKVAYKSGPNLGFATPYMCQF